MSDLIEFRKLLEDELDKLLGKAGSILPVMECREALIGQLQMVLAEFDRACSPENIEKAIEEEEKKYPKFGFSYDEKLIARNVALRLIPKSEEK